MHDLIIIGAGGFAREIRQFIPQCFPAGSTQLKGFLSHNPHDLDRFNTPQLILGTPETYNPQENDRFLLGIGDTEHRRRVTETLLERNAIFVTMIHPTAYIDPSAKMGQGCVIYPFVTVMNEAKLADFVAMNIYSSAGHDTQIGKFCNLSPYATMNGFSTLEDDVFLGTHASVLASNRVGRGSKVSANSVVTQDVRPEMLVYGVPGRHIPLISQRE